MAHIDYYFGTQSPWTYLAGDRLEQIATRHGAQITYKPLDLLQLVDRTGGVRPANRHPSRMEYRGQELTRWAKHLGKPLNLKPTFWPVNTAPSSYAVIAAAKAGGGDLAGLVQSFVRAVWAEDQNIADDAVIRAKLTAAGFDPELANSGLFVGAQVYERNLEEAVEAGVFGAPFYIVRESDERFWGQDRLDMLDQHLADL
ncbi:2-hydroxychromene-2-carboxylate isomerase [Paracoccus laeviglucosivorans]|uniref:2-hydroxychromene-2-carboxylate isomerase n=1 Tax=Paracoccus laeviglucosivorans TaxID=1197861 RepID=A0A521CWL8_9RHOB|nr:2-hydroxychromene-2-carboxylate isomerase [Paracoccus laeviglucosivorans]SMO63836.1 2-hydroxychromene-2-carboxylate isomerase [Paracoccus laeviglucosivorans]